MCYQSGNGFTRTSLKTAFWRGERDHHCLFLRLVTHRITYHNTIFARFFNTVPNTVQSMFDVWKNRVTQNDRNKILFSYKLSKF
jgi:hypothetical protein